MEIARGEPSPWDGINSLIGRRFRDPARRAKVLAKLVSCELADLEEANFELAQEQADYVKACRRLPEGIFLKEMFDR